MKGPPGETMPRRSNRVHSPSSTGFDPEAIRRTMKASLRSAGNEGATADGKRQTPLAKLRSRFGYTTSVESKNDSETFEVANKKAARVPSRKKRANDNVRTSGKATKTKKIKMFAGGYKSRNETPNDNRNERKRSVLEQLEEDSDSIPESMFPHWVQQKSNDTNEKGSIG
jgi:hypothetical protein